MSTKPAAADFTAQRKLDVVGVPRKGRKFGNMAFKELKAKGYQLLPLNSYAETIECDRCYPSLSSLPEPVDGVLIVIPPAESEKVVRQAAAVKRS